MIGFGPQKQVQCSACMNSSGWAFPPDASAELENDYDYHENLQLVLLQHTDVPSFEQVQQSLYRKGLEEIEQLQLLDLSPLATWKLSSHKPGYGLAQLRDDSPLTYWQSDGSAGNNMEQGNTDVSQLSHPHSVTLQFLKRVSLERISIFTNYHLDELYTPLRIVVMAGGSYWDLTHVCHIDLDKPMGWLHIVFDKARADGLLKCFVVKLIIVANHQDGKDSHIRAIRCYGKKLGFLDLPAPQAETELLDQQTARILGNVNDVIGFNTGFQSIELSSESCIR